MDKVYLYIFRDNDGISNDYYIATKHDCKKLIDDIESNYFDIIDCENKDELIEQLKENNVCKQLIDFVKKDDIGFDSCYELELAILDELDELIECEENIFYY